MIGIRRALNVNPKPKLLRALAARVERVPERSFDMMNFCGTARCAFGHAPSVPAIRETGLRIVYELGAPELRLRKKDEEAVRDVCNKAARYFGNFERAEFVFGITAKESEDAFGGHLRARADVAKNLRKIASKYDGKAA